MPATDFKLIDRPPGISDALWDQFRTTVYSKGNVPIDVIEEQSSKPAWLKEPEHNPALQAPPADQTYNIRLDASRFGNDTEAAIANKAVQDQYRRISMPASIADGFTQTLQEANAKLAGLEGEARAEYLEREQATLVRTYGQERAQTMLDKADRMAKQLGSSAGFVEAIGGPNAFHSASAILAAANAYDLLQYRKGK